MLQIAICDDEEKCLENTKSMIESWANTTSLQIKIHCFDNGDSLIRESENTQYNIVFLDIFMPAINGMDVARELRLRDKTVKIIFLTSSPEFALQSYSVKATDYCIKPIEYQKLKETMEDCAAAFNGQEPENLILKTLGGYQKIYLHDIEYIEAQNKRVFFFLKSGQSLELVQPLYTFETRLLEFILGMINNSTLLIFGVFVSAALLSIPFHKKNIFVLSIFCILVNGIQFVCYAKYGLEGALWLYPIITHVPSLLIYFFHYKRKFISSIFGVLSAYLFCEFSKWISMLFLVITGKLWVAYGIRAVLNIIIGFVIIRYFVPSIAVILTKPFKTVLIFTMLPAAYYIFDYMATVYTDLLYSGSELVYEFLPFVLSIAYLIFGVVYFKEYEEKCEIEQHNQLMEMKREQWEKEVEAIKRSEHAIALIRHDMRHFLSNISAYIEHGDTDKAKSYIREIIALTDKTAMNKYCENDIVNMILSSYENEISEKGIRFCYTIKIPAKLPVSDVDFTSILSNGLENAIHAVSKLAPEKERSINLDLRIYKDKILLSIKNPYEDGVDMLHGIPQAKESGHGLGTQSIKYVTEKLKGNYQFIAKDGQFALRVVL